MEYSAARSKEIQKEATTWTHLEDIVLGEISQTLKDQLFVGVYETPRVVTYVEIKSRDLPGSPVAKTPYVGGPGSLPD